MSATVTIVSNSSSIDNSHTNALRGEVSRICQTVQNPIALGVFGFGSELTIQDLASNISKKKRSRSRQRSWTKDTLSTRESVTRTLFGTVTTTSRSRLSRSKFVDSDGLDDEEYQYEHESSFRILPAQWLLQLNFNFAYEVSIYNFSTQGWQ